MDARESSGATARVLEPAPPVLVPDPGTVFLHRARRFKALAKHHALGDWLRFLGHLSSAQHEALKKVAGLPLPDATAIERTQRDRVPPVPALGWRLPDAWRDALLRIVAATHRHAPPPAARSLADLEGTPPSQLDALAQRVLRGDRRPRDTDLAPFVAAALQVVWTSAAAGLGRAGIRPLDAGAVCPCCGSAPVASVVRDAGETRNLRYLHCSLCNTEWNMVRVKCAACESGMAVSYRHLGGSDLAAAPAVRAETCDECMSYLKIVYRDKAPAADPVADDLATLALDILVNEAGYARAGPNLLFLPGG